MANNLSITVTDASGAKTTLTGVSVAVAALAMVALSSDFIDEDKPAGTVVGGLSVLNSGIGPWTYTLLDNAGGMFAVAGTNLVVGATALDHGSTPKPTIIVQATNGTTTIQTTITINVRVRAFALPQTGDLVFGAQGNMGYPVKAGASMFTVAAGREHTLCETYLPGQPSGARVIYADSWGNALGTAPAEYDLPNGETIAWSSLMNALNGTARQADVAFTEFGLGIAGGGFTLSDPIGVTIADGNALRTVISVPVGSQRMANNGFNIIGEQQKASATLSTFDNARTTQAASAVGTGIFNAEGFTATGIVAPRAAGFRSFLLIGTSIMRGQDTTYRFIQSPSRNAYGYLPVGLDLLTNGRMGWWQAAINGQDILKQNDDAPGKFRRRFAILEAIALKNSGRWPFTDIVVDLRNDFVALNGIDAADTLALWIARTTEQTAAIKELFRGVPVHLVDIPPIQSIGSTFLASRYGTEPALQVPAGGNYKAAAVKAWNAWVASNFASIGAASVISAGTACFAPDDGSGIAKWRQTPFTAAGGGTFDAAIAAGLNLSTVGITVASTVQPEVGAYLAFFDADMANPENPGGNANGYSGGYITSVAAAGAGKWLVKINSGTAARARAAGAIVRTSATQDGTHPSHWLQHGPMADAVVVWKATI